MLEKFPNAQFYQQADELHEHALAIFSSDFSSENQPLGQIKLHLKGTDFQLKVWESLLKI
jgi:AraC family transcriptional regulator of adaptative response/methylated-DNA-[protein]-cysteine methyltransferase